MTIRADKGANEFVLSKDNVFFQFQEQEVSWFGSYSYTIANVSCFEFGRQKKQFWMLTTGNVLPAFRIVESDDELFNRAEKLSKTTYNKDRSNVIKLLSRMSTMTFEQNLEVKKLLFIYDLDNIYALVFNNQSSQLDMIGELIKLGDLHMLSVTIQLSMILQMVGLGASTLALDL